MVASSQQEHGYWCDAIYGLPSLLRIGPWSSLTGSPSLRIADQLDVPVPGNRSTAGGADDRDRALPVARPDEQLLIGKPRLDLELQRRRRHAQSQARRIANAAAPAG